MEERIESLWGCIRGYINLLRKINRGYLKGKEKREGKKRKSLQASRIIFEMELEKMEMKKYFKKNKVYFGNTDMEIRKLKKKDDYFYIYVDKDFEKYYMGGEVKGKYYCLYAREIEWGNKDGIERINRKF